MKILPSHQGLEAKAEEDGTPFLAGCNVRGSQMAPLLAWDCFPQGHVMRKARQTGSGNMAAEKEHWNQADLSFNKDWMIQIIYMPSNKVFLFGTVY